VRAEAWDGARPAAFRGISGSDLKTMTDCQWMQGEQVAQIPDTLFMHMTAACVGSMPAPAFASLSTMQLKELPVSSAIAITAQQVAAMSPTRCSQWSSEDVFKHLSVGVCAGLTPACIAGMEAKNVETLVGTEACMSRLGTQARVTALRTISAPTVRAVSKPSAGAAWASKAIFVGAVVAMAGVAGWGYGAARLPRSRSEAYQKL